MLDTYNPCALHAARVFNELFSKLYPNQSLLDYLTQYGSMFAACAAAEQKVPAAPPVPASSDPDPFSASAPSDDAFPVDRIGDLQRFIVVEHLDGSKERRYLATVREAAEMMKCTKTTIYKYINVKRLESVTLLVDGKDVKFITKESINRALQGYKSRPSRSAFDFGY